MPKNFGIGRTSINVRACNSADHQLRLSQRRIWRRGSGCLELHATRQRTEPSCRAVGTRFGSRRFLLRLNSVGGKDVTRDQQSNGAAPARQHDPGSGGLGQKSGSFPRCIGAYRRRSHGASRRERDCIFVIAAACRRYATTTVCWNRRSPRCASSSATPSPRATPAWAARPLR